MSPKYLIISEVFYPEEFLVNDFVFDIKQRGFDVEVLTRTPSYPYGKPYKGYKNKLFQKQKKDGIIINHVSIIPGYARKKFIKIINYLWFALVTSIYLLLKGKKYSVFFVYQTGPLTVALAGVLGKKRWGKKLVIYTQDVWPDTIYAYGFKKTKLLEKALNFYVSWTYKHADKILVSCKGFISRIQAFAQQKDIVYVPNWIPKRFETVENIENTLQFYYGQNFTFAGNIGKVQNLENIILGFNEFLKQNTQGKTVYLNIVGDGSNLADLKKLVDLKKIPNVIFWGRLPQESMPGIFQQSTALIISLIDKPIFGLTVPSKFQAYLSAHKPIFCVMKGEVADLVSENELGVVASPSDILEIADGFKQIIECVPEKYSNYVHNTQRISKSDYEQSKNIEKIIALLNKLTNTTE